MPGMGVQGQDIIREQLNRLHDIDGLPWRKVALLDAYKGIPAGSLCSYAMGRPIKNLEHRRIFGLPLIIEIDGKRYELTEIT